MIKICCKIHQTKKSLIIKLIWFISAGIVCIIPCLIMYLAIIKFQRDGNLLWSDGAQPFGTNKLIYYEIIWNHGVSFGLFSNHGWIYVSLIQLFGVLFLFLIIVFIKRKICYISLSFVFFGGLFNLIQRIANDQHCVLDYLKFGFMKFAIFNFPDVFVCCGMCAFVISYLVFALKDLNNEKNKKDVLKIYDTHAHLNVSPLLEKCEEIVKECQEKNIFLNCVGTNVQDSETAIKLANKYDNMFAIIGIHPDNVTDEKTQIKQLNDLLQNNKAKIVAIGETGLDYYNLTEKDNLQEIKQKQKASFIAHLRLAKQYKLPVVVHVRNAWADALEIIKNNCQKSDHILIHCFTGEKHDLEKLLPYSNIYFSLSGIITFNNAKQLLETTDLIPNDRLLIETDSPFLSPVPFRGKTNVPMHVIQTCEFLARHKGMELNELKKQLWNNSCTFFKKANLKKR